MKYIAYARKSTDEKDKQVLSIDNQISELKEFALRENLEIVDFLTEAQSAKVTGRPIFNSLVKRIEKGEAQGIVSWNPDRIARNSVDGGKIIYLLDTGELQSLKFPTHWFENTPQGRFMLSIAFGQAKYYVDNLSQNVSRGLKYKIKTGVWPARAPMGYRNDRNIKSIVVYEPEARPLRKAFELYSTGKYALDGIGKFLFEQGMKNKYSGGQLNDSNLRRVLMRPFYTGYMVFRGEMFKGTHTPLISKELFDKCQVVRKQRGYYHQVKATRYNFAFTGLIKCKYCGCSITAEHRPFYFPRTHHKADYIYYHCTKKKGECCQKGYTREEILEVQFREIIKSLSVSEAWVDQMNNFLVQDIETQKDEDKISSSSLETEISQTEQKLDTLLEAYLDTVIDSESYIKKKNELMERKANLVSKQRELTSDNPNWIEGVQNYITCAQKCAKIARAENNCHDLADMAKKVGSKYFLKDKKIEFCLYFPYNLLAANGGAASFPAQFVPTLAFGQSKYFVDSLSENTKRGLRQKVRRGEMPGVAPLGYLNDSRTKTIVVDKRNAPFVRELFTRFATDRYTLKTMTHFLAQHGITTSGGKLLKDTVSRILSNPFYYGHFRYAGEIHEGIQEPLISKKLFDQVQEVLHIRCHSWAQERPVKQYTGLLRCGECGMMVTAEVKKKFYKRTNREAIYTYYHCTKKSKNQHCSQSYIREEELDRQLSEILQTVSLSKDWAEKMIQKLDNEKNETAQSFPACVAEKRDTIRAITVKLQRLLDSYLDQDIDKEEYRPRKAKLLSDKKTLEESISRLQHTQTSWLEPMRKWIIEASEVEQIARGEDKNAKKVLAAKIFGSNLTLSRQIARGDAREPWAALCAAPTSRNWERRSGFEPLTFSLGRRHSTTELTPQSTLNHTMIW